MTVLVRIALRNLVQARVRSTLLSLAIGLVTAMLVLLLSIAGGLEDNLVVSATTLSSGHVTVAGFHKSKPTDAAPIVTEAARLRKILTERTPGLVSMLDRQRGWGKLVSASATVQTSLSGIALAQEGRMLDALELAPESEYRKDGGEARPGRFLDLEKPNSIILFASQARRLEVGVGDMVTVQTETRGGQTNTLDALVVAVARDVGLMSSFSVFLPWESVRSLYQLNPDATGAFWLYLEDIDDATDVMNELRGVLAAEGYEVMDHVEAPFFFKFETVAGEDWTGQKLDLTIWRDEVSFLAWVLTAFDTVTWMLSLVLVAIIAVGIMNALWNSVRERTREIGTLRAIGMRRSQVMWMVLLEALFLGLFATTAGAIAGAAVALALDAAEIRVGVEAVRVILLADTLHLAVRPVAVGSAVVALTLLCGLAAAWPAGRAARMRPVTAMQHAE